MLLCSFHFVDFVQIPFERPSEKVLGSQSFSAYKGTTTLKVLLAIGADGQVLFVSKAYLPRGASDVELVKSARDLQGRTFLSVLDQWKDTVLLADKGFPIRSLLKSHKVDLSMPAFLLDQRLSAREIDRSRSVSSHRLVVLSFLFFLYFLFVFAAPALCGW
jgi:hypothetical protein